MRKRADEREQYMHQGNYGKECTDCVSYRVEAPIYYPITGLTYVYMNCTCEGMGGEAAMNLGMF